MTQIGVLALQGDFEEHLSLLRQLGMEGAQVRLPADLQGINGLIIPGGESTTIGKLAVTYDLIGPLKQFGRTNAIWGTCAGAIFLSRDARRDQPLLGLMDIRVERNAFGRQAQSFTTDIDVPVLTNPQRPFPAVFIRAPVIERVGAGVSILATLPGEGDSPMIVAARQGRFLATSFHPELTGDSRFHRYFIQMAGS
ncbi:MAG: pyridoxal 5'-phosphate synthase glutaminase subunit PdxT [Anaerolineales bacterium]|nr:pyridoxal 5'-phosphate synthase glutaminase subunit PdxT [Anaerolineales bacterium]